MPASPQEAVKRRLMLMDMVKADLSSGKLKEWGTFNGKDGYSIIEGTEQDVISGLLKFMPHVLYEVYPILSADDYIAAVKETAEAMQA